jgi:hypothetical protein
MRNRRWRDARLSNLASTMLPFQGFCIAAVEQLGITILPLQDFCIGAFSMSVRKAALVVAR